MSLACIVFDCDGVILDSVPTKTRAFARLAEPYGAEARDRFVMYHMTHGGVSRYRKFAWFFSEILGREITPQESEEWGKRFASYSLEEVKRCPLIPGVEKALTDWEGKLPMCVCSRRNCVPFSTCASFRTSSGLFLGLRLPKPRSSPISSGN